MAKKEPRITAAAYVSAQDWTTENDDGGIDAYRIAQAQTALDEGLTLDALLKAPASRYAAAVNANLRAANEQAQLAPERPLRFDPDGNAHLGSFIFREPLGKDISLNARVGAYRSILLTAAKCGGVTPDKLGEVSYEEYLALESWIGKQAGLGGEE